MENKNPELPPSREGENWESENAYDRARRSLELEAQVSGKSEDDVLQERVSHFGGRVIRYETRTFPDRISHLFRRLRNKNS